MDHLVEYADPAKDKMGKVVHLKPKPDQPA